jgi:hypothetical protein
MITEHVMEHASQHHHQPRFAQLCAWLQDWLGYEPTLTAITCDASRRHYWRFQHQQQHWLAVDAPPETENNDAFVTLSQSLSALGLSVPTVIHADLVQGWLVISDLGEQAYLHALTPTSVDRLYGDALGALMVLQAVGPTTGLPRYDSALLQRELDLFSTWVLQHGLQLPPDLALYQEFITIGEQLITQALAQPQICVHRDFHSRNLIVRTTGNPGILDFQDAVIGPVTYDVVSLLRDCYIDWPDDQVAAWAWGYFDLAVQSGVLTTAHAPMFWQWFEWMGMQRHLKAAGIFVRLALRDGRRDYLAALPRTLNYIYAVTQRYQELNRFGDQLQQWVIPALHRI